MVFKYFKRLLRRGQEQIQIGNEQINWPEMQQWRSKLDIRGMNGKYCETLE